MPIELVYADPAYDVSGSLLYSADQKQVIGIQYEAETSKLVYWDPEVKRLQQHIDEALHHRTNKIIFS